MIYWFLKHFVVGPPVRLIFRPWAEGRQHIPAQGAAILASNHLSFSDSIFLPLLVDRRLTFPAKKEYFTGKGVKGWLSRQFFTMTGQIPIDRSGGKASLQALDLGLQVLRDGELFGIYPEGTRSPDGRLYRGKTGMARLSVAADVPIIPCAMINTDKAQPTGQRLPNVVQVGVRVGRPIHHPEHVGKTDDRAVLRMITDEVMRELQRLSGQEYVDEYAATVKERLAAATRAGLTQARDSIVGVSGRAREGLAEARDSIAEVSEKARDRAWRGIEDVITRGGPPHRDPRSRLTSRQEHPG